MSQPTDQKQREQALNPHASFIVQAPAGSGKTELLVQRYLTLLAKVNQPEEIIALTFTRKAAAEMRLRILQALNNAETAILMENVHQEKTQQLATAVLQHEKICGWNLLNNPNRFQILTIDSLCLNLTRKMPILSHFGATPEIEENAKDYYLKAARKLLATLENTVPWSAALQKLLLHLDNNHTIVEKLFVNMLQHREQWLPHILAAKDQQELRKNLEKSLQNIIQENLKNCHQLFPTNLHNELKELMRFAIDNINIEKKIPLFSKNGYLQNFPAINLEDFSTWLKIINFLLTDDFTWRKKIDITIGFPPTNKIMKQRMKNFIADLEQLENLRLALKNIKESPAAEYQDEQWEIVNALVELLPVLAAHLTVIFRQHGLVDFIEISSSAIKALGEPGLPTDLALQLDYKIQHLLVDEFQDTSLMQFRLLELLTAGWQENDGRTLFLVGDPMQSIYRFRQAEVGLFLRAKNFGIGYVKLIPLYLHVNFRSDAKIISWTNTVFQNLFPKQENIASGAVTYYSSTAAQSTTEECAVKIIPGIDTDIRQQAKAITELILTIKNNKPKETIAILVRSRSHLLEIIPALKKAGLKFHGVEIEKLSENPAVQDVFALTRALLHLADDIAWLAILRAPWCGLTLADLYHLRNTNKKITVWQMICEYQNISALSQDAKMRLAKILPILMAALQNRQRQNLRQWVENTWRALGGPASCNDANELNYAQHFFALLEEFSPDDDTEDLLWLTEKLANIFAPPDQDSDSNLQVMTIHRAKGLEFDNVILPCLERKTNIDKNRLLMWLERPRPQAGSDLILAPIKSSFMINENIYDYLKIQEKQKADYEDIRLLYVAMTRAKKTLHLFGNVSFNYETGSLKTPNTASFLHLLWPIIEQEFITAVNSSHPIKNLPLEFPQILQRFKIAWQSSLLTEIVTKPMNENIQLQNSVLHLQNQIVGIIIHQILQQISIEGWKNWDMNKIKTQQNYWKKLLIQAGISGQPATSALILIDKAINLTLNDQRGQWLLTQHEHAASELALTAVQNEKIIHLIIDRTFIHDNIRWVVDYKTSCPNETENVELFLANQKLLYQEQLNLYGQAIQNIDDSLSLRFGLYFPLFGGWLEFAPQEIMPTL